MTKLLLLLLIVLSGMNVQAAAPDFAKSKPLMKKSFETELNREEKLLNCLTAATPELYNAQGCVKVKSDAIAHLKTSVAAKKTSLECLEKTTSLETFQKCMIEKLRASAKK
ncbi:MAG: hypothetical protein V4760_18540 [Bdellovibrionota bacterium]